MAKMSIDEFNRKLSEKLGENEDLAIELMEDATDSFNIEDNAEEYRKAIEEKDAEIGRINTELTDLKAKYKDRFLTPASADSINSIREDIPVEMQEREVIDIRVI